MDMKELLTWALILIGLGFFIAWALLTKGKIFSIFDFL